MKRAVLKSQFPRYDLNGNQREMIFRFENNTGQLLVGCDDVKNMEEFCECLKMNARIARESIETDTNEFLQYASHNTQ